MKYLLISCILIISYSISYSQSDWEYLGVFKDNDIYFLKSTVSKGINTSVVVAAKPKIVKTDEEGIPYEYVSVSCIFRKNSQNEVRCLITNKIIYYDKRTFKKAEFTTMDVGLNFHKVVTDLWNRIKN